MRYSRPPAIGPRFLSRCLTVLGLALPFGGCLERTNPFDPINQASPLIVIIREENRAALDSMVFAGLSTPQEVQLFLQRYADDTTANTVRRGANQAKRDTNLAREQANEVRKAANEVAVDPDSLRYLLPYLQLNPLAGVGPYAWLESARSRSREAIFRVRERAYAVNAASVPVIVYPQAFIDSVLAPLQRDLAEADTLLSRIDAYNSAIERENLAIGVENEAIGARNVEVELYNKGVEFRRDALRKGVVTHPDSLEDAIQTAQPGDTILIGPTTLPVRLQQFTSGTQENPIVIRGYPGRKTILKPIGATNEIGNLDSIKFVRFEDLVFRGASSSGIKLTNESRDVEFHRCLFDSNGVWGIDATDSDLRLKDCEILANGGGIRVAATPGSDVRMELENVLIARNGSGGGIMAVSPMGRIAGSTIADNAGDGLHIESHQRSLAVENTILSGNSGYGVFRERTTINPTGLSMKSCDLWQNRVPEDPDDDWYLVNLDSAVAQELRSGNFSDNPLFVDPAAYDYNLRPESPLVTYEKSPPFVVIGYRRKQ